MPQLVGQMDSSSTIEKPNPRDLGFESHADGLLGQADILGVVQAAPHHVTGAVQGGQQLRRRGSGSRPFPHPARRAGGGLLAGQRGGGHLSAGHAVVGVIDKDHGDVFAARRRMDNFTHANGGQVAVALVGEHQPVGQHALDAGGHRRGAPVRGLHKIEIEIIVGKHRAAHRGYADHFFAHAHFVDHFGDQAVGHAVGAARAVMGGASAAIRGVSIQVVQASVLCTMPDSSLSSGRRSSRQPAVARMAVPGSTGPWTMRRISVEDFIGEGHDPAQAAEEFDRAAVGDCQAHIFQHLAGVHFDHQNAPCARLSSGDDLARGRGSARWAAASPTLMPSARASAHRRKRHAPRGAKTDHRKFGVIHDSIL